MFNDQSELLTSGVLATAGRGDSETRRINTLLRRGAGRSAPKQRGNVTPEVARLVAHFHGEAERARNYLYSFHRQWFINIASYLGSAGVRTESVAKALKVNLKTSTSRITHTSNKIGGYCRRLVGYLARSNPDIDFVAADLDDPLQIDYARGAKRWLDWQGTYDNWKEKRLETLNWAVTCGLGVTKASYDWTGGPRAKAVDEMGQPIIGSDGKPMLDKRGRPKMYETGIAHTAVIPPFHYVYSISARNREELNWNGEDSWMSFRYLESLRPGIVSEFGLAPEAQFTSNSALYERQILQSVGPQQAFAVGGQESSEAGCVVRQIFVSPYYLDHASFGDEMYEQGAFLMFAQGQVLDLIPNKLLDMEGVNPRLDWNPYTVWPCFSVPGRMVPQGLPDNVIPVRESRDFIVSRLRETQRLMGQPKWFVQRGSINQQINNEASQQIDYSPGFTRPEAWAPPPLQAGALALVELLDTDMEQIASQPPMMQGQAQGQVRSGLAVTALQEQALTMFTPIVETHSACYARHVRQLLLREIQDGDAERRIPRRIGSGEWTQDLFFAKHMNPQFMVRIVPGTEMPVNRASILAELDWMVSSGRLMMQNPQHADVVDRALGYQIPNMSPDDSEQAMSQARYENWMILEHPEEVLRTWAQFNHRVHLNEHIRFFNSRRVQDRIKREIDMLGMSPTLIRFNEHIGLHKGHLLAIQQGLVLPQPVFPFEDLAMQMQGADPSGGAGGPQQGGGQARGGQPGARPGRSGDFTGTGSQNGFARPSTPDQMNGGNGMDQPGIAMPQMAGSQPAGGA